MWRNPKFFPPDQVAQMDRPAPPEDAGRRLATLERSNGQEMRISLAEFNGHQFVKCQVWQRNEDGDCWPMKGKCATLKPRELGEAIAALRAAQDLLDRGAEDENQSQERMPRSSARPQAVGGPGAGGVSTATRTAGPRDDRPTYAEPRRRPEPRALSEDDQAVLLRGSDGRGDHGAY